MGACFGSEDENEGESGSKAPQNLSVSILTWNVGTSAPGDSMEALFEHKDFDTDICVVGLEEVVELNLKNVVIDDDKNDNLWKKKVLSLLNKDGDNYSLLQSKDMVGILLLIFVKKDIRENIKNVVAQESKTGMFTVVGNKGAVGIRFVLNNSSLCFLCCHLEAHKDEVDERNEDYHEILKELKFKVDDDEDASVFSHDVVFMFGDLNYRLNFAADELQAVYELINDGKYDDLLEKDQLINAIKNEKAFVGFNEEDISFQPTYKFEPGTNEYEQKKKRMPSYCDRILWRTEANKKVNCLKYDAYVEQALSDHKPVVGLYQLEV